uniref:Putative secreted protein n=1 Tax=Anopheles triannulatus TaxID=58253 RepID=A0A2M4B0R3_9DIPT
MKVKPRENQLILAAIQMLLLRGCGSIVEARCYGKSDPFLRFRLVFLQWLNHSSATNLSPSNQAPMVFHTSA